MTPEQVRRAGWPSTDTSREERKPADFLETPLKITSILVQLPVATCMDQQAQRPKQEVNMCCW